MLAHKCVWVNVGKCSSHMGASRCPPYTCVSAFPLSCAVVLMLCCRARLRGHATQLRGNAGVRVCSQQYLHLQLCVARPSLIDVSAPGLNRLPVTQLVQVLDRMGASR